ncbi:MAG TPA: hypothetical protein VGE13_02600 [Candidatus Saccharimonadales bacterium]
MYTLKSIAQRSTMLGAAAALIVAAVVPAASVFADALNPLTERSLLLSSSAPGYQDTDGSGNSETTLNANGETFAVPGSGPNGKKTGETFTFKVSSTSPPDVKGISFQYCTTAAGSCKAPGNNTGDARDSDRQVNTGPTGGHANGTSDLDIVGSFTEGAAAGQFQVLKNGNPVTGWSFTTLNAEDNGWIDPVGGGAHEVGLTGKNNYIYLTNAAGETFSAGDEVQVVFKASTSNYITNPGYGSFFVKINTYDTDDATDASSTDGDAGDGSQGFTQITPLATNNHVIDGGVTVANVMTDSIHITTKVLETMSFSVGTRNRDTVVVDCTPINVQTGCEGSGSVHGPCDPIQQINNNRLQLGDQNAEFSLDTRKAYDVHSYWRLSSNSSGGATVYYSGNTLANTVGDEIAEMATEQVSTPGIPQFGLAYGNLAGDTLAGDFGGSAPTIAPFDLGTDPASADYNEAGAATTIDNGAGGAGTAKFKFLKSSSTVPEPIAQQNEEVISCATAKMRYVANIGADTPAGVYTTKINYLAAPQY